MSLATTITALRTAIDTISGLRVYADPPESINEFPSAIIYSSDGTYDLGSANHSRAYHMVVVDVYLARQLLPQAIDSAKAWPTAVYDAVKTAYAAGSIDVVATGGQAAFTYRSGPMRYNDIDHFGVRFMIRLKELLT